MYFRTIANSLLPFVEGLANREPTQARQRANSSIIDRRNVEVPTRYSVCHIIHLVFEYVSLLTIHLYPKPPPGEVSRIGGKLDRLYTQATT